MNILTADIDLVVIVWRDCQRGGPNEAILKVRRDVSAGLIGPHFDITCLAGLQIEDFDDAADAARPGRAVPDDVVVDRIGSGPAALAAGDIDPGAAGNSATTETAAAGATGAAV